MAHMVGRKIQLKLTSITLIFFSCSLFAQGVNFDWVRQFGGTSNDLIGGVTTDDAGYIYVTGSFRNTVDFDPGAGTVNLTSPGGFSDMFIQKLDSNGNHVWIKQISGSANDSGGNIYIDSLGMLYVSGNTYSSSLDLNPNAGSDNYTNNGGRDIFIIKMDTSGNYIWGNGFGGSGDESISSITCDSIGNLWLTGTLENSMDIDPSPSVFTLTSSGYRDGMIAKFSLNGDLLYARTIGSSVNHDDAIAIHSNNGYIYTTGRFSGTIDFDPGTAVVSKTALGVSDGYLQKLDLQGNLIWVDVFSGNNNDWAQSIVTDVNGDIYLKGRTVSDSIDLDPGTGSNFITEQAFLLKLNASGNLIWSRGFDYFSNTSGVASLIVDPSSHVFMVGDFSGTVDFDPSPNTFDLTSTLNDIYLLELDGSGNFVAVQQYGGSGNDFVSGIHLSLDNDIFLCGSFQNSVDFNSSIGDSILTSNGNSDGYVLKLNQCQLTSGTDIQSACGSFTWIDGNTYTTSTNTPTWTLVNTAGCDSIVTLDLTITNSTSGTDIQSACDSYTWIDGNTYTASTNSPTWTLTNSSGCDSLVTLDLTINAANANVTQTGNLLTADQSGATYQWVECPSMSTISGETNQSYTATSDGEYAVIVTENGCSEISSCYTVVGTGISSLTSIPIEVYPNPTHDGLVMLKLTEFGLRIEVKVLTLEGKIVSFEKLEKTGQTVSVFLPETEGLYFIEVQVGDEVFIQKVQRL